MKLRCTIGTLVVMQTKPRMRLSAGDIFEVSEELGTKLLATGDVVLIEEPVPVTPEPEPNPSDNEPVLEIQKKRTPKRRR